MLSTSLKTEAEAFALPIHWIPQRPTVQAYVEMWTLKPFGLYFWNSTLVSGVTALLSTAVGALAGYGFSRFQFRFRTTLMAGFLATQMISGVLVIGPYFQILAAVEMYNTLTGLIIAYVTICLPFAAWMSKGYFDSIPKELDEAGLVDGASRLQIFLRIIMPIAVPGTVATLLFGFLLAWQDLLWALCLISIDEKRTVTLGVAFTVGDFIVKWPMLTAASLIGSLPTIILYLFLQRFYVEGLARGAVKG
jgi:ABC-type glycerol-3-phosphate transport system permease component